MSIASVAHSRVFGINIDVLDNIFYVDENTLLYSAGCNVVIANVEQDSQKYIPLSGYGICAMTISSDRHVFAVAQRGAPGDMPGKGTRGAEGATALITMYEIHSSRKRRSVVPMDGCISKFTALSFSTDAKYLAAQGGAPDWLLHFYVWEKGKLLATICTSQDGESAVRQIGINPMDETELCVVAAKGVKLYRYAEGGLRETPVAGLEQLNYTCHAWLPPASSRIALGTSTGQIVIINNGEVVQTLNFSDSVACLMALSRGFACGGGGGVLQVYERYTEEALAKDLFKSVRKIPLPEEARVRNMTGSSSEGILFVEMETCQVFKFVLTEQKSLKGEEPKLRPLSQPFHSGAVTGLDTCVRKPILVTCSVDRSIRIWNYQTNTCELVKYFSEEPFSVALHPSGLYILVGFSDKLRLMNILMDDLRVFREFGLRGCRECRFSSGGHMFAAAQGNMIQIFSTWTFENLANLKGHNGRVRSLVWTQDDAYLVSAGADGAVYAWSVAEMKRENEHILKSTAYSCAVVAKDGKTMWAVGSDMMLKEITESTVTIEFESDQALTQLVLSNSGRMLFAGTASGTIRAIKYPLSGHADDFQEHIAHSGAITKLRVSYDDQYLFSASEDGTIYVFKISDKEERGLRRERVMVFADEILITKSDLEEKTIQTSELRRSLEELQIEHEYQLRLRDMAFNEKMKDLSEKFSGEMEALKISTSALRTGKEKEEVKHEEAMAKLLQKHATELHEVEAHYNQELMEEYEKFQAAQQDAHGMQESWQQQMRRCETETQQALTSAQADWEGKLNQKAAEIEKLQSDLRNQLAEQAEEHNQITQDIDTEITRLHAKYDRKLRAEREEGARLKGENGIMRKKFNTLTKDIEDNRAEIVRMKEDERTLKGIIDGLEKEITALKKEMSERDILIQEKERRVYDLKKKNQELEKFKFVLDFRIKELKEQIEPRETHIKDMTTHISSINTALEVLTAQKEKFTTTISELTSRLNQTKNTYRNQHSKAHQLTHYVKSFLTDLEDAVHYIQEPEILRAAVEKLEDKYLGDAPRGDLVDSGIEPEVDREYIAQNQVLRERIKELQGVVEGNLKKFRIDETGSVMVNRGLIGDINRLRRMTKQSAKQIKNLQVLAITEVPVVPGRSLSTSGASGVVAALDSGGTKLPTLVEGRAGVGVS
ncbi:uncharacterized protein SPPG_04888 [Spizellomyces punctatus DAOM BR117]|uniref:EML-like second beta-propeller domain-containing protein n=1 Tax=Spizellomyces punctatus (strain DAOM BR117) TaxID=645134 RepID=A0A0L0HEG3_SPIPD|nr:uncharacterized protein SPPG_04888 [Spizellomyces punctatus DAOM BR117]KNC99492.1 hypothetical protein SPPG_04888 [Spizellomyces punctatus DAOM BR117]|eukprot:XP_016607532.1 hypothetical protein SPPG_04888 [Spizellomyces punctatus DAOM BR117]